MSGQIVEEGWFLLHSFLFGIALTFLYDIFRIFRRIISHGMFWISVEDLLFWIGASLGTFYLLYRENNGTFRWFAVLGAGIGMLLYEKLLGERLVGIPWSRINCRLTGLLKTIKIKLKLANDQRK